MQIVIYEVLLIVYITYYVEKQQRMIIIQNQQLSN
jgi:hypothetical protein